MTRHGDALLRLRSHQERNALDSERHDRMRGRFDALANRGNPRERVAVSEGLFITPPEIARRIVEMAHIQAGARLLEPSAGTGRILDAVQALGVPVDVTAAELCPRLCRHLFESYPGTRLRAGDFLSLTFPAPFDVVVMNPPFRRGTDVQHITRALEWLKPGGVLVSLCYDGAAQAKHLRPIADHWETLPARSFKSEGTSAGVVLLSITKPTDAP